MKTRFWWSDLLLYLLALKGFEGSFTESIECERTPLDVIYRPLFFDSVAQERSEFIDHVSPLSHASLFPYSLSS